MLLTCPTCRSGLQVPDGTTAQVRCPTCRTIFGPNQEAPAVVPPPPPPPPQSRPPAARPAPKKHDDEDEARARKRRQREAERESLEREEEARRAKRKAAREAADAKMSPEDRRIQRAQFIRGMWGCKLLSLSFLLYILSLSFILIFLVTAVIATIVPSILVLAGGLGLLNWILGAVGTVLCLTSRPAPGHWGYGIAAMIGVVLHGLLFAVVVARAPANAASVGGGTEIDAEYFSWGAMPTQLHIVTFYLPQFIYPDMDLIHKGAFGLGLAAGICELVRLMLIMVFVSCVAQSAGYNELSYRCTRAAGVGTFGPFILSTGILLLVSFLVESGGIDSTIGKILLTVAIMGIYAILAGMLMPSMVACRETSEACEAPYEAKSYLAP